MDGKVAELGMKVDSETQSIRIDGKPLPEVQKPALFIHNKRRGWVVSREQKEHRNRLLIPVLASTLGVKHLISVGRLDMNSEGLLLLTNSPQLADWLTRSDLPRRYLMRVHGTLPSPNTLRLRP